MLILPSSIFARTLTAYRANINSAKLLAQNLFSPDTEDESFTDYLKLERETLREIRAKVPASEKIEWQNASVETNNQWLIDNLVRFEKEPRESPKRSQILIEIIERLDALDKKFDELENPSAQNRTKDEDKQKLAEILRREEYQQAEEKQESFFQKLYRKLIEWLAEFLPRPNPSTASPTAGFGAVSFILQIILYALLFGAIGFLIYRFAPFFAKRFKNKERGEKKERVILGERLREDETAQNLFDEAERLARTGNLRGAIRKGYIALLCELSERKIIGLSQHKTNRDYLKDVRKQNDLYKNMSGLTSNYERHWYGFDSAEETDWEEFRNGYRKAVGSSSRQ
ncbi:MAG: hypothetical protein M3388_01385 [Acidobacteriota bacterium]|nr:hypothetical protein [Acidobacteriota bacterium]